MNRKTHKIRRMLTALALSAVAALFAVPLAQARNTVVDDWFRDAKPAQPQSTPQPGNLTGDYMFRDYLRNQAKANDHILDVSARDTVQVPSGKPNLLGDNMFRDYFRNASKANDNILDVSSRDARTSAPIASVATGGTDWQKIGIGIGMTLGGALLLVVLVAIGLEARHAKHRLGSA